MAVETAEKSYMQFAEDTGLDIKSYIVANRDVLQRWSPWVLDWVDVATFTGRFDSTIAEKLVAGSRGTSEVYRIKRMKQKWPPRFGLEETYPEFWY